MELNAISLGRYFLFFAAITCLYTIVAATTSGITKDVTWQRSARRGAYATVGMVLASSICLWYLLLTSNFEVQYVWQYTDIHLSDFLKFSAFWAGQKGSLLFWAFMLNAYVLAFIIRERHHQRDGLSAYATAVLMGVNLFFLGMLNTVSNPFDRHPTIPLDGNGLNPLLQHPAMIIHPPILFLGYVGFAVPFAYAMGSLLAGRTNNDWVKRSRIFNMVPWTALTVGIVLGGRWAYEELGWGGYWAWDPVENASFIPWLIGTAFIHSVMIQERKNMLKGWNVSLAAMTFISCVLGTYLTRSGVVQSVHSFGVSPLGNFFLAFLVLSIVFSFVVIISRMHLLKATATFQSPFSREGAFMANNVIFLSFAFIVLIGTVAPTFWEGIFGYRITVREPFFNLFVVPWGMVVLAFTGIGPLISWGKADVNNFQKNFFGPLIAGVCTVPLLLAIGWRNWIAIAFWSLSVFVLGTIFLEMGRGALAVRRNTGLNLAQSLARLINRNRRRYGGYIVHLGIVVMVMGIIASSIFQIERDIALHPGESYEVGYALKDFRVTYNEMELIEWPHKDSVKAIVSVEHLNAGTTETLYPEKQYFIKDSQPHTQVQVISTLMDDFYIMMTGFAPDEGARFKIYINPLVNWVWWGTGIVAIGALISMTPRRRRQEATVSVAETAGAVGARA